MLLSALNLSNSAIRLETVVKFPQNPIITPTIQYWSVLFLEYWYLFYMIAKIPIHQVPVTLIMNVPTGNV